MIRSWAVLALWAGCGKNHAPPAAEPAPAPAPVPAPAPAPVTSPPLVMPPSERTPPPEMIRLLSARDDAAPCEVIEATSTDPVADLILVVETVPLPPYAPMRAAGCLVDRHAEEAAGTIESWMGRPDVPALAEIVAQGFDTMPSGLALRFAAAGLAGPHRAVVEPFVKSSTHPEVRALVEQAP